MIKRIALIIVVLVVAMISQHRMSMDSMVGPDFETGLQNLKALAEK